MHAAEHFLLLRTRNGGVPDANVAPHLEPIGALTTAIYYLFIATVLLHTQLVCQQIGDSTLIAHRLGAIIIARLGLTYIIVEEKVLDAFGALSLLKVIIVAKEDYGDAFMIFEQIVLFALHAQGLSVLQTMRTIMDALIVIRG